ncbi:MAG: bifunctional nicotinamidase/pyrazinamidase [Parachlamydia sp.]|jgi:nicotinamidase/pyrazinamidase|nr:bifunctional nicotinamidase/pyrazinamidase [Parachlamydia sp.]
MKALLVVDLQNDFLPGGALGVHGGDEIIPLINEMIHYPFDLIIATKDWHPSTHGSFASVHQKKPGKHITLSGMDQTLWPDHCVQQTQGSNFALGWDQTCINKVFYKGTDAAIDSYSAFFDNGHIKSTGLSDYLKENSIKEVFIAGLTTEYCVKYTVLDALQLGFNPYVVVDACRPVDLVKGDGALALQVMQQAGATLLSFGDLKALIAQK